MKKVTRTAAMIGLMFGMFTGSANDGKLSLLENTNAKDIVFEIDSSVRQASVKVVDPMGNVIFSEDIAGGEYAKKFDLSSLENGLYYFISEDVLSTVTYKLEVSEVEVLILGKKEEAKPVFNKRDGMVYLNLLNLDMSKVLIEIVDSNDRTIFSEKLEDTTLVEKAFNFTGAYEDVYTIVIKKSGKTYYEIINIEK